MRFNHHQQSFRRDLGPTVFAMARGNKRKRPVAEPKIEEENLNRFAGSSDEEDNDSGDDEEAAHTAARDDAVAADHESNSESEADSDSERDDPSVAETPPVDEHPQADSDSEAEDETAAAASGMAKAMARILGTKAPTKGATTSVVLSKIKTPLQKQAEQEKLQAKEMLDKRRQNRERSLQALHVPLSVATSSSIGDLSSTGLVNELEKERSHRRVATRGVVALFNAIAQHQQSGGATTEAAVPAKTSKGKTSVAKMTKDSFLDMIKNKARGQTPGENKKDDATKETGWKALRDDFMMDSKKQWDEVESDEEAECGGDDSGQEEEATEQLRGV